MKTQGHLADLDGTTSKATINIDVLADLDNPHHGLINGLARQVIQR